MMRLTLKSVRLVFCAAWRLAESPTRRPSSVKATHEGVVRSPSELARTCASPSVDQGPTVHRKLHVRFGPLSCGVRWPA